MGQIADQDRRIAELERQVADIQENQEKTIKEIIKRLIVDKYDFEAEEAAGETLPDNPADVASDLYEGIAVDLSKTGNSEEVAPGESRQLVEDSAPTTAAPVEEMKAANASNEATADKVGASEESKTAE